MYFDKKKKLGFNLYITYDIILLCTYEQSNHISLIKILLSHMTKIIRVSQLYNEVSSTDNFSWFHHYIQHFEAITIFSSIVQGLIIDWLDSTTLFLTQENKQK